MRFLKRFWPQLALLLVGLIWGSSNVVIKSAVEEIPAAFLIALRCTLASALLALVFWKKLRTIRPRDLAAGAIIGACLFLAYYTQTRSIFFTNPGKSGFLASIYSVIVPFLYWAFCKKKPTWRNLLAAVLCIGGVILCSVTEEFSITWGDSMAIISGVIYAAHIVTIEKYGSDKDPVVMSILQFGFSAVYAWIVSLFTEVSAWALPGAAVADVLYLALACTGLAMLLQNLGQNKVNPNLASILMSTESVFGVLISVLAGYEILTGKLIIGFVLIFAAIVISELHFGKDTANAA